ncbi:hypothetical protein BP5796_07025 [Coleophoma crateriformis]|uniref:Uncharacterized protein n=1 Tax=Coleophoma crateriformis TaxID=565419 RepID=A0A3D8RQP4_9HELO|nr:hypothetical protein BP5796_07025 [Coleophoma crateriformis]
MAPLSFDLTTKFAAWTLVLGVACPALYVLWSITYNLFFHPLRSYPGPLLWRISRLPRDYYNLKGELHVPMLAFHKKYGTVIRIAPDELSFASAQAQKDVLSISPGKVEFPKDPRRLQRTPNGIMPISGADKDTHARYRRLLSHAFSERGLREQEPRIQKYADLLVQRLSEKAEANEATNMIDWYIMTEFDLIGDLAWGDNFECLKTGIKHQWIIASEQNLQHVSHMAVLRRWNLDSWGSWLLSPTIVEGRKKNFEQAQQLMDKRVAYDGPPRGDFWDHVLIKSENDNEKGEGLTKAEMMINASVLVVGGMEPVSTALGGATFLLLKHPEKMQKLLGEIRSAFTSAHEIDIQAMNRLPYLHACFEETMRLYPPAPTPFARVPPVGGGMVDGKHVPEWTEINLLPSMGNRLESNFHRPDDFVPERWLKDAPVEFANDQKAACQVFSLGIRNCIGRNLAYAESRLIMTKVLYNFDLELAQGQDDWLNQKIYLVWQKGPLYVKLSKVYH